MTPLDVKAKCDTNHVYEKYKTEISELIAYVEVYEHDLSAEIMALTAELFQAIALCEVDSNPENNASLHEVLDDTFNKVNRYLNKHTIYVILKKIKQYKKIFKKYNYKGVYIKDGQKFYEYAEQTEAAIVETYYARLDDCYKQATCRKGERLKFKDRCKYRFSKLLKKEPCLPTDELTVDFTDCFLSAKNLLQCYQNVFPKVISNGKKQSPGVSFFNFIVTWLIPLALSIPIIWKIIEYIKNLHLNL